MARRLSTVFTLTAGMAIAGLALSACGSSTLSTPAPSGSTAAATQSADAALAAMLPAKVKSSGQLVVGVDSTYAPNEFLNADGKTVEGMDVDLFDAVAQKLGIKKVVWTPASFPTIITGVEGGKYDIGISSFTINKTRLGQVNMVSYFNAGTQWAAAAGNPKKVNPTSPCGLNVAVQQGTVQEQVQMPPLVAACAKTGKPINLQIYGGQDQATAAVVAGKADTMLADSPVVAYAIKQSGGKLVAVGSIYSSAPYGAVVPKSETQFAQAIASALKAVSADGAYKKVLSTWGNTAGATTTFVVNPTVSQ